MVHDPMRMRYCSLLGCVALLAGCATSAGSSRVRSTEPNPTVEGPERSPAVYVEELAAASDAVLGCTGGRALRLRLKLADDGRGMRLSGEIATATERECIERALRAVRVRSVATPREVETRFPPPARRAATTASPATSPATSLAAWTHVTLARHRYAVLACVGGAVVQVRVVAEGGEATWSLVGELAGSSEEACVAAVLGGDTPPASGTLVRVVQ